MFLFYLFAIIQCVYVLYFFIRIFYLRSGKRSVKERRPVSIIICAKNEAENLEKNLPAILAQKYSNPDSDRDGKGLYEVIVVNDASDDNTAEVLKELQQQHDNLRVVTIPAGEIRNFQGKKFALSKGVAFASYDWLLLTDADCVPASTGWLEKMVTPLAHGKSIVAGYGGYHYGRGLLNAFIRWETMHTFLQFSTYALAGMPYMAVGRNMACTKDIFLKAQQTELWNTLPSGDDDLLVSIAGNAVNTAIVADKAAFTFTNAKTNMGDWVKQKQRHLSTGKYYKWHIQLLLGIYGIAHTGLWLCFLGLSFTKYSGMVWAIMASRCLIYWLLWMITAQKLRERKQVYLFPLFDIGWMVYNFVFFPYITWKNKRTWK